MPGLPADDRTPAPTKKRFDSATRAAVRAAIVQHEAGDSAAAYQAALPLAEQGDHEAQRLVGNILAMGALGHAYVTAARPWWERAALSGDAVAQFNLGLSYTDPAAEGTDSALAQAWITEAALGGHTDAMTQLGEQLLGGAGDDLGRAADGYAWLRTACVTGELSARMALGRALKASSWDDPARLEVLQPEALRRSAPYAATKGADLLAQADRDEARAYFVSFGLAKIAGDQGLVENAFTANPTKPSPATLPAMARKLSGEIAARSGMLVPPDTTAWVLCRRGILYDDVDAVALSAARLWELVRVGDTVEISDGVNSHVTFACSIDRNAGVIRFLDVWPDEFLLLPGLNVLGIEAWLEPYGRTRRLVCITRDDFVQAVRGVMGVAGVDSIDAVWRGVAELQSDAGAAVALASAMARLPGAGACARGLGWLMALLRGDGTRAPADRTGVVADRAWMAAERLHGEHPRHLVCCTAPGATGRGERPRALLDELARRWPPCFDSLAPRDMVDAVSRRLASDVEATQQSAWRRWWKGWRSRARADALLRADAVGAEALLEFALRRYPDNERLRMARALRRLDRGEADAAASELAEVVDALEAKRLQRGPLVRDLDGIEGGINSERRSFAVAEAKALALRAQALMSLSAPRDAVTALQKALILIGRDESDMLALLAQAATAAGDAALAADAQARLEQARTKQWIDRVLGG